MPKTNETAHAGRPPGREALCRALAERLDDAVFVRLFPDCDPAELRRILCPAAARPEEAPPAIEPTTPANRRGAPQGWCRLFTDGASRGNPGHAGGGAALFGDDGAELGVISKYLGVCTNNVAEYRALLAGLEEARRIGCFRIALFMDSELVARQLEGRYKVKHEQLKPLHQEAMALLAGFEAWTVTHVPRSENALADRLANEGIDRHLGRRSGD